MKIKKMPAHKSCFHEKRNRKTINYIVIHYTGNTNDTAANNGRYFQRKQSGSRWGVGAHFFVGKKGVIVRSIPMNRVAWSVGGFVTNKSGAGTYYNKCTNQNSVSIELCSATKGYTDKQAEAVKWLVKYIQKRCPNAKTIIRHWDVNGKSCPAPMAGEDNKMWKEFKKVICQN
ncbi:MAG: N-acetylmuramoyl-L-alanine amidase [Eubacterium sp.]|nr:N-acetylmuramoyl-L-alanine amidase [Eubacterium sp.]